MNTQVASTEINLDIFVKRNADIRWQDVNDVIKIDFGLRLQVLNNERIGF